MNTQYLKLIQDLGINPELIPTIIETGTHRGAGAEMWSKIFKKVYTIELSDDLYRYCCDSYNLPNVSFLHGASTKVLPDVIKQINTPYVLFLDAHGSGGDTTFDYSVGRWGSPVLQELDCVKENKPTWILIDDLSDFDNIQTYPKRNEIINKVSQLGNYSSEIYSSDALHKGIFVFKLL